MFGIRKLEKRIKELEDRTMSFEKKKRSLFGDLLGTYPKSYTYEEAIKKLDRDIEYRREFSVRTREMVTMLYEHLGLCLTKDDRERVEPCPLEEKDETSDS